MRTSWREYFLRMAEVVGSRATCDRAKVGVVLVRGNRVLVTGYNGAPPGEAHCDDVGHDVVKGHCLRAVHAEANAVCQAANHGVNIAGATCYATHEPCRRCALLLKAAGVAEVVFSRPYTNR